MKQLAKVLLAAACAVGLGACSDSGTSQWRNAITGEECTPSGEVTLHGHNGQGNGNGGHNSPTGIPGDNIDDLHSGQIDCLGDGDSGQGNDERNCGLCDSSECCEVPPGDEGDPGDIEPGEDGSGDGDLPPPPDDGSDDGGGEVPPPDDGGGETPPDDGSDLPEDPLPDEPVVN